ncbi:MAG: prephenate dehydrogenase [Planctomycetota bacterium]|jgi:prephenate dehydrogenase
MSTLHLLGWGRFGEAIAELARDAGHTIRAFDPDAEVPAEWRATSVQDLLSEPGLVLCAVPMAKFYSILVELRPHLGAQHTIVDVASVKHGAREAMLEVCGDQIPWVSTHPLFGPTSIALGERPLRVVVCPDTPHRAAFEAASSFYSHLGCTVFEQTSVEHDKLMADTHALAFFVAKGMLELGLGDEEVVPPSFHAMAATIDSVRSDAGHLFFPIQHQNPFAPNSRERLLDAMSRIHRELLDVRLKPESPSSADSLAIQPSQTPKELGEARASIDAIDVELVELLARRTKIALRAARAKREQGRQVQDPAREEQVLERRRKLASEHSLDPDAVTDVFEAILRFSRSEQRRWLDAQD